VILTSTGRSRDRSQAKQAAPGDHRAERPQCCRDRTWAPRLQTFCGSRQSWSRRRRPR